MAYGDLTTLADVKTWLQTSQSAFPPTDDALVSRLITAASQYIQTWLNRQIALCDYIEVRDGTGGQRLQFARFPVCAVQSLTIDGITIPPAPPPVPSTGLTAGYVFSPTQLAIRGYYFTRRVQNVIITYSAGYAATPHWTDKELYGQLQFPVAIARGQGKISGKAKFAQILGLLYSDIFFGTPVATGQFAVSQLEAAIVPAVTPYTATVANAATYNDDLGVVYAATGKRFNRVTTPSAAGQYSVNFATGVYTFAAADANVALLISYTYNVTTSGNKLTLTNQLMGTTPTFKATFYTTYSGEGLTLRLNACTANKLSMPTKIDDWSISELDFMAFADASGTIGYLSTVE